MVDATTILKDAAKAELPTVALPFQLVHVETITQAAHFSSLAQSGLLTNPIRFCTEQRKMLTVPKLSVQPQIANSRKNGSAEFPGNVIFGFFFARIGENDVGTTEFHHLTQVHVGSKI